MKQLWYLFTSVVHDVISISKKKKKKGKEKKRKEKTPKNLCVQTVVTIYQFQACTRSIMLDLSDFTSSPFQSRSPNSSPFQIRLYMLSNQTSPGGPDWDLSEQMVRTVRYFDLVAFPLQG